ncbi:MAG TPA: hypothetical protein VFN21_14045 [Acidimicrobiales bacterium]|nr:hypothetical protein [Acidimicrobiales bacterium]
MRGSRILAAAGLMGMLAAGAAATGTPLGAQTRPIHTDPGASVTIDAPGSNPAVLRTTSASVFDGQLDDASGTLTGAVALAGDTSTISGTPLGNDAQVTAFFSTGTAIQNGVVAEDGAVSFDDTLTVEFFEFVVGGSIVDVPLECAIGPVDLHYVGTYDATTDRITVTAGPVSVPPIGARACEDVSGVVADWLTDATMTVSLDFPVSVDEDSLEPSTTPPDSGTSLSTIDVDGIVSKGCEVTVPIIFGEGGRYTLEVSTADGRVVDSVHITRNAAGPYAVHLTIDLGSEAHVGARVNFVLKDAAGARIADGSSSVTDPRACLTAPDPPLVAPAARAVSTAPTFTG